MTPPQQYTARLEEKNVYNQKFVKYSFELVEPHRLDFQAGQYVSIQVSPEGERRSYSIVSSPDIKHGFELLIDSGPGGIGVKYLDNLDFGDTISFLAPMGQFVLPLKLEPALTFVASGSGIAPFRSMIIDLLQVKQDKRPMVLHWGLRHVNDMIWVNDFEDFAEKFENFKFHPVISQAPNEWPLCKGRVTDCLNFHKLLENSGYYLCGSNAMITDVKTVLSQRGVQLENIHHEKFY